MDTKAPHWAHKPFGWRIRALAASSAQELARKWTRASLPLHRRAIAPCGIAQMSSADAERIERACAPSRWTAVQRFVMICVHAQVTGVSGVLGVSVKRSPRGQVARSAPHERICEALQDARTRHAALSGSSSSLEVKESAESVLGRVPEVQLQHCEDTAV